MKEIIVCHYSEIGLKGKNRKFFEEQLIKNIKGKLNSSFFSFIRRISGRIIIGLTLEGQENKEKVKESLKLVFGISNFSFAKNLTQDIKSIQSNIFEIAKNEKFKTFKINAKRSNKEFYLSSKEINEKMGEYLLSKLKNKKVKLTNPDIVFFIEIVEKYVFIFTKKIKGSNGLPVGSSGKAISLISGGIDSPVASFLAMKRGLNIVFVHFHSYPQTSYSSINKVKELVKILSRYQGKSKLYCVSISEAQKEVALNVSQKLRVIFYRKIMIKIAQEIAKKERSQTLVLGDSIGQVASQTIENMKIIEHNTDCLIIRPLVCMDKMEIVKRAQEIKTFDVSIIPYDDFCARFLPKSPETKAKKAEVLLEEKKINMEKITKKAVKEMEVIIINSKI